MEADDQILFELPVELELRKSQGSSTPRRILRGYASTASRDRDGETVLQQGMDFSPLLKSGFINYDHQGKCLQCQTVSDRPVCPECGSKAKMPIVIGFPISAEIRDSGWWLESELYNGAGSDGTTSDQLRLADETWAIGMAMQKSGGSRSLSYSVEGGVLQRHGNKVVKSVVRHCAVTLKPVNEDANVELFMKSLCCGRCHKDHPLHTKGHSCGGHEADAIQKAMSTESAAPLTLQNLDRRMTSVLYGEGNSVGSCDCCEPGGKFKGGITGAVEHLKKCQGLSQDQSIAFLRKIIHNAPQQPELSALVAKAGLTGN
jgi:hypothetical protein